MDSSIDSILMRVLKALVFIRDFLKRLVGKGFCKVNYSLHIADCLKIGELSPEHFFSL